MRNSIILSKIEFLSGVIEQQKWNESATEVTLLEQLREQHKQLEALVERVENQSNAHIKVNLGNLIEHIDKETKVENSPTEDKATFIDKAQKLNDYITKESEEIANLITGSETTPVATAG
ncbi:hypothetical protein QBC45DRAFT_333188 [Copromyces sp. CBS 386.78]|nr:hypothetical protein QBC45DRAFT_333188 [Copromyces sp. CBS 386.78]